MQLNCFVDADFAGLWSSEDPQDPVCVKSRAGFVLTFGGCPLIWCSKLQTEVALSTTEAEYIALSQSMRELLPMRRLIKEVGTELNLAFVQPALIHTTVFEDNNGAIILATGTKITPRTKHLAVKWHFFRDKIGTEQGILLEKICSLLQLADILTKGLALKQFQFLRKFLMEGFPLPEDLTAVDAI